MTVTSCRRLVHPQRGDCLRGEGAEHPRQEKKQPHHFPPTCHRLPMGCASTQRSHVLREIFGDVYGSGQTHEPVIFTRSSSGKRSRISAGKRSCTRRAPRRATSTTVVGAGVATATTSQISAESANPPSAVNSSQQRVARPKVPDHAKCQQKHRRRNRGQHDQGDVNNTVDFLPAAAVFAGGKVVLVVLAHLGRDAGNIIPPAGQNLAYEGVDTLDSYFVTTAESAP